MVLMDRVGEMDYRDQLGGDRLEGEFEVCQPVLQKEVEEENRLYRRPF